MFILKIFFITIVFLTQFNHSIAWAQNSKEQVRERIVLAGGCFWCLEPPFDELKDRGVLETRVGYAGGGKASASYDLVSKGQTKHLEVIEIIYDPNKIELKKLYEIFIRNIDPFDQAGQFCDRGRHYRAAVFLKNEREKKAFNEALEEAVTYLKDKDRFEKELAILKFDKKPFYEGEDYHQDYYLKNPIRYKFYRYNCGRDKRLEKLWGDSSN